MKKPLLCILGIHSFGDRDWEAPDPENPTRRVPMSYCRRSGYCNKRRVNGQVVTIPQEMQSEREARFNVPYKPLPPAPQSLLDEVKNSPRVSDDEDGFST